MRTRVLASVLIVLFIAVTVLVSWKILASNSESNIRVQNPVESTGTTQTTIPQVAEQKEDSAGVVITSGASRYGTMLFDEKGQAIYIWELEETAKAECYGDCAELWPPVITKGSPKATGEVQNELLSTTNRSDGSTQVTYNGHPLYYYAHEGVGEVECHNIATHGGLWWVIQPNGVRVI